MYFLAQIVLASAALLSTIAASPLEKRGSFSVTEVPNPKFVANGPAAYARALMKYNKPIPHDLTVALGNDGSVTATPTNPYDQAYVCPVSIDGQTLALKFDTGSADLWVFSTSLPAAQQIGHVIFDPLKSKNWKNLPGYTWNLTYGDKSSASGTVGTDVVTIGGTSVSGQAVEIASQVSSKYISDTTSNGVLGLAFSSTNAVKPVAQKTFFDTAKSSLSSPVFTADLKYHAPGTYDFGIINSTKYTGPITYINLNISDLWGYNGTGYAVGNGTFVPSTILSVADTGTSLMFLPDAVVTAYYKQVSGASYDTSVGGYSFSCSAILPNLTLGIGSYRAVIPGKHINYSPTGPKCYGGIQSNAVFGGFTILGDIFFKSQFVVFDGSVNRRLGFATKPT